MSTSSTANLTSPPERTEVVAELERILASDPFRRAERHARFLSFVCETTLNGNGSQLNEYLIAHEVFGRGSDYSPGEDSVVRRQAHAVRQKLQDYYGGPGKEDAVRIVLPVGRYIPNFVRLDVQPAVVPQVVEPLPKPEVALPPKSWIPLLMAGSMLLAGLAVGWFSGHARLTHSSSPIPPALEEIWSPWLHDSEGATFCFSNPLTAVVKQFDEPVADNTIPPRLLMRAEEARHFRKWLHMPEGGYIYMSPALSQAKMGEAIGSVNLASMLAAQHVPIHTTQSRLLSWDDFRSSNLILLGHDEANRWVDPILAKLPIRLAATDGDKPRRILDSQAHGSESPEYRIYYSANSDQPSQDFALISMLPGLDGKHHLLLVNGLNADGTETALEYLGDASAAQTLLAALRRASPQHKGTWHFQAVLRTEVREKVPTRTDLLVVRVL